MRETVLFSFIVAASLFGIPGASAQHRFADVGQTAMPAPSGGSGCAEGGAYHRLNGREIEAAITDKMLIYDWSSGIDRAIRAERFQRRSSRRPYRYLVRYEGQASGGTYSIVDDRLCTHDRGSGAAICRRMFRSPACGYALSGPGADHPRYRVRIVNDQ